MTVFDDFPSKKESGLQIKEMQRIMFMGVMTLLKRRFPAQYAELVVWWSNQ